MQKKYFYIVAIFIIALICSCGANNDNATDATAAEDAPHPGKKIYTMYCLTCHGYDGSMGANGAHNLKLSELTKEEKILVVKKGRNTMTAFEKVISEDKIEQVVDYISQFKSEE